MKTIQEQIEDIYPMLGKSRVELIPQELVIQAIEAANNNDNSQATEVLSSIWQIVAQHAGGYQLERMDPDTFGKKIGWITNKTHDTEHVENAMRDYLANYMRELARPPMEQAIQSAANEGLVKEVYRNAEGAQTCSWCLEKCGVWAPIDANAYGVWKRHQGCDCQIGIRWVKEED